MPTIYLVADDRGEYLGKYINPISRNVRVIEYHPGAGLGDIWLGLKEVMELRDPDSIMDPPPPTAIVVYAGINNIVNREQLPDKVSLHDLNPLLGAVKMMAEYEQLIQNAKKLNPTIPVMVSQIHGVDLAALTNSAGRHPLQGD